MAESGTSTENDAISSGLGLAAAGANLIPGVGTLISAGLTIGGLVMKGIGTGGEVSAARSLANTENEIAQQQTQIAGQKNVLTTSTINAELNIENVRRQAMEIDARRKQLENIRNAQQALALSQVAAGSQGALFGSGLVGGQASVTGKAGVNAIGIAQQLSMGEEVFGYNRLISENRIGTANLQLQSDTLGYKAKMAENTYKANAATYSGVSSMGGSLINAATPVGNILSGPNKKT